MISSWHIIVFLVFYNNSSVFLLLIYSGISERTFNALLKMTSDYDIKLCKSAAMINKLNKLLCEHVINS